MKKPAWIFHSIPVGNVVAKCQRSNIWTVDIIGRIFGHGWLLKASVKLTIGKFTFQPVLRFSAAVAYILAGIV